MSRVAPVSTGPKNEVHSPDLPIHQPPPIMTAADLDDEVIVADPSVLESGYVERLAFMNEPVRVMLHRTSEKHAPTRHCFSVNGRDKWLTVEQPEWIPRCYLEVIVRAQPFEVETEVNKNEDKGVHAVVDNIVRRSSSSKYPYTVVEDRNPRGAEWLRQVMRGN